MFAQWLLDVGHGSLNDAEGRVALPTSMRCDDTRALIDAVHPGVQSRPSPPPNYFLERVILAPRNDEVHSLNRDVLDLSDGEDCFYPSADTVEVEDGADEEVIELPEFPPEYLRSLSPSGIPLGELHLKVGCPLILLRNLTPRRDYWGGSITIVPPPSLGLRL